MLFGQSGFPQGSILGPLFFILYVNDLPKSIRAAECLLFADDTSTFYQNCNYKTPMEYLKELYHENYKMPIKLRET